MRGVGGSGLSIQRRTRPGAGAGRLSASRGQARPGEAVASGALAGQGGWDPLWLSASRIQVKGGWGKVAVPDRGLGAGEVTQR